MTKNKRLKSYNGILAGKQVDRYYINNGLTGQEYATWQLNNHKELLDYTNQLLNALSAKVTTTRLI